MPLCLLFDLPARFFARLPFFCSARLLTHFGQNICALNALSESNPVAFVAPVKKEITEKIPVREGGYTAEELAAPKEFLPDDVDPDRKEEFLTPEEFRRALKMEKDEFTRSPAWKRQQKKKEAGLF